MAESGCSSSKEDFSTWLSEQGFSQKIIDVFAGLQYLVAIAALLTENEVGREKFLLLTDDDIAVMVKPILEQGGSS